MIQFPRSRVKQFYKDNPFWREQGLRLGQAFSSYMELHKVTNPEDKSLCDQIFAADSQKACRLIIANTDWEN